jgi:hypothetical protein
MRWAVWDPDTGEGPLNRLAAAARWRALQWRARLRMNTLPGGTAHYGRRRRRRPRWLHRL